MKKLSFILVFAVIMSMFSQIQVNALTFTPSTEVYSEAAYLINLDTDTVIYEKNSDKVMYPASLTKIMTAIIAIENIEDLENTQIEAPSYIFDELYQSGASTADFRPREVATAKDLLYGLMLQSACEAGSILADHVGGSVEGFVEMMNNKAVEIGCENTHFVNAHGLHHPDQYTTAKDMAKIMEYAVSLPEFKEIASTYSYEIPANNKHTEPRNIYHTNKMILRTSDYYYEPIGPSKTGTTDEAGRCLASTASFGGYNYLLVTLGGPMKDEEGNNFQSAFLDAKSLYEWAFAYFRETTILSVTEELGEVSVKYSAGADHILVHPEHGFEMFWPTSIETTVIEKKVNLPKEIEAPVKAGDKIGTLELRCSGETLAEINLLASQGVEKSALAYNLDLVKKFFSSIWFKVTLGVVLFFVAGYVALVIIANKKKKKRRRMNRNARPVNRQRPPRR